jgi:hypothetical protein
MMNLLKIVKYNIMMTKSIINILSNIDISGELVNRSNEWDDYEDTLCEW